jgi:NitT/TauT family transport system substrate-binding protein
MKLRMLLNGEFSGPHAFFFLAKERGWLAEEGIDLTLVPGNGAATIVPRITQESFDIGYGDINALIEAVAIDGEEAPIAVWATFNTCPFTIAVRADGPVRSPRDFEGRAISGSPTDAALKTFAALALQTHVDWSPIRPMTECSASSTPSSPPWPPAAARPPQICASSTTRTGWAICMRMP